LTDLVGERLTTDSGADNLDKQGDQAKGDKPKAGRVLWVSEMNQALAEALPGSQWLVSVEADQLAAGRQICLDLWPFIRHLPEQIKAVKDKLPDSLEPAKLFLNSLADEERHYQELYIKQCQLAGIERTQLMAAKVEATQSIATLQKVMDQACFEGGVVEGVQAIVAAELAATYFARACRDAFEQYFAEHAADYAPSQIEEGLSWLRLHAKPNTRHALWMNRMLVALTEKHDDKTLPPTVKKILKSIFSLWRVEKPVEEKWLIQEH
jgi:pyrroloquinoline quinone (PQQ) biosynthesis protein C